jgi:hypothetical protein
MRRFTVSAVASALLLASPGHAQEEAEPPAEEGEQASETEGAEVVDQPAGKVAVDPNAKTSAPGEVHTVAQGDTLWDLSQKYLGSPWYWPKVWSYNPEIANPHWIYPGNKVRFFASGEELPTQVEVGDGPEGAVGAAPEGDPGSLEEEYPTGGEDYVNLNEGGDASPVEVVGKIGVTPPAAVRLIKTGFVTIKELDASGIIDSSFAESKMLSFPDTVYVKFRQSSPAKVGERYLIFKTVSDVTHPQGGRYGYVTKLLGAVKVLMVAEKLVKAQILETWDEVGRGDLIGPYGENLVKNIIPTPNEANLRGFIIGNLENDMTMYGENHMLVIDKGSADGVREGNTFTVVRQSDLGGEDFMNPSVSNSRYPLEDIATCMAYDVRDKATTCIMTRSIREVVWGDRVELRAGNAPRASR